MKILTATTGVRASVRKLEGSGLCLYGHLEAGTPPERAVIQESAMEDQRRTSLALLRLWAWEI